MYKNYKSPLFEVSNSPIWETLEQVTYDVKDLAKIYKKDDELKNISRLDNIVLKITDRQINLAHLCYLQSRKLAEKDNSKISVVSTSIDNKKLYLVGFILKYVAAEFINKNTIGTGRTLQTQIQNIVKFINYAEENKLHLNNITESRIALEHYTNYLLHQIKIFDQDRKIGLTSGAAQMYQIYPLRFCSFMHSCDLSTLTNGLHVIIKNHKQTQSAIPLNDKELEDHFNFYTSLFRQLTTIVLDHKKLPSQINLPNQTLWIAPSKAWIKPAHKKNEQGLRSFNYSTGEFYSFEEMRTQERFKNKPDWYIRQQIKEAHQGLEKQNNEFSSVRLKLASWACKAYFMHFLTITGENDCTASSLLYDSEYDIEKSEQHFKSIKWRAGGVETKYSLQSTFLPDFKRYLKLRSYLISYYRQPYKYLFISNALNSLTPLSHRGSVSSTIRSYVTKQITGEKLAGSSRQLRVTKGIWIRKSHGAGISSYILNHDIKTNLTSYSGRNEEQTDQEMTDYFDKLDDQLLNSEDKSFSTSAGHCKSPNNPTSEEQSPIIANCVQTQGCLFCDKYCCHNDEVDIRKLTSIKYIVELSQTNINAKDDYNRVFKPIIQRIDDIFDRMINKDNKSKGLIAKINNEVFHNENLTPYWTRKLELLEQLGML